AGRVRENAEDRGTGTGPGALGGGRLRAVRGRRAEDGPGHRRDGQQGRTRPQRLGQLPEWGDHELSRPGDRPGDEARRLQRQAAVFAGGPRGDRGAGSAAAWVTAPVYLLARLQITTLRGEPGSWPPPEERSREPSGLKRTRMTHSGLGSTFRSV